jgi:hypothetical protein
VKTSARIFLSYARKDKHAVAKLYDDLAAQGHAPWMDSKDILPGENFQRAIDKAIRDSDLILAILTSNSVDRRGFIQRELKQGLDLWKERLEGDIYIIPVRLEDCKGPESLAMFQWVDLFEKDGWSKLLKAIEEALKRLGP